MSAETLIHYVVMIEPTDPSAKQLSGDGGNLGVEPNKRLGAVVPVRAVSGEQRFACDEADMKKVAGKLWEGAYHHGCGDPQFVNCPFCKETEQYKKDMAEHERFAREDGGKFKGIFDRIQSEKRASGDGGASGAVASPGVTDPSPAPVHSGSVLPPVAVPAAGAGAD